MTACRRPGGQKSAGFWLVLLVIALLPAPASADDGAAGDVLHSWQATVRYGQFGGPTDDDGGLRIGYGQNNRFAVGLRAGVGARGFARLEAGLTRRESKRSDMQLRSTADGQFIGLSGGYMVSPLVTAGISAQYGFARGGDDYGPFGPFLKTQNHTWRVSPFVSLTPPPVAGFDLSLMLALSHMRSYTRYDPDSSFPLLGAEDIGKTSLRMADIGISRQVTPRLTLGGSVSWMQITSQQTQGVDLPADEDAGSFSLSAGYRLNDSWRISFDASRDFKNDRGNGFGWSAGVAYRF